MFNVGFECRKRFCRRFKEILLWLWSCAFRMGFIFVTHVFSNDKLTENRLRPRSAYVDWRNHKVLRISPIHIKGIYLVEEESKIGVSEIEERTWTRR